MIGYISDSPVCDPWSPSSYVIYHNFCKGANFFIIPSILLKSNDNFSEDVIKPICIEDFTLIRYKSLF